MDMIEQLPSEVKSRTRSPRALVYDVLLVLLLVAGAAYRLVGLDWDGDQNLHPDERFLTGVETALVPVESFGDYFNTEESTLNPHNQGYGFFVYGTFPIFIVRYAAEWLDQAGWSEVNLVGRQLSALADLLAVVVVYLIGTRMYDRRAGLLAAAFSTFTVLNIQLSHFFAVDTFLSLFTLLTVYFAIVVATDKGLSADKPFRPLHFVLFGVVLGMAAASKVSGVVVAATLPLAVLVRIFGLEEERRLEASWIALQYLILAAAASLLTFRLLQPYAFSGPGFFGVSLNEKWLENLSSLRAQITGDADWPPSIQWARRPLWFSGKNMLLWGMGLPMGILAWAGFAWSGWRMLKGEWRTHLVLWAWTAGYFGWQSLQFNPTMRYQLPVYPALAVFAGWVVIAMWDTGKDWIAARPEAGKRLQRVALDVGLLGLGLTVLYASAFITIYERPVTRVAASEWIYQNIPGPLTLPIETGEGVYNQQISYPYDYLIGPSTPFNGSFNSKAAGWLEEINVNSLSIPAERRTIVVRVIDPQAGQEPVVLIRQDIDFTIEGGEYFQDVVLDINPQTVLLPGQSYLITIGLEPGLGDMVLEEVLAQTLLPGGENAVSLLENPVVVSLELTSELVISVEEPAALTQLNLALRVVPRENPAAHTLYLSLAETPDHASPLATSLLSVDLSEGRANRLTFKFDAPFQIEEDVHYYLRISVGNPGGVVSLKGAAIGVEAPWDDPVPLRTGGYDAYGGIYQRDLHFDMNADDNPDKLARYLELLAISDYFTISSSRQWASTTRIPERFPLNIAFYRELLGCPEEQTIEWCYNVADVGTLEGNLGFELIQVFQSDPTLGNFRLNDQFAEEAFTVYDHPKVFIFQKAAGYDHQRATDILSAVDLSNVIRLTPKEAAGYKDLMLPPDRLEGQRAGGTWAELFNGNAAGALGQAGALAGWYLALLLLGLAAYPLLRVALSGLPDKGYPMARAAGMLLLAYLAWMAGSIGLSYNRPVIWSAYLLVLGLGAWQGYRQREALKQEWRAKGKYFLIVEALFLGFFLLMLLVRFGNPDLWHPYKGGEKPMDFSYFNAVLKSTSFPPYDPWYAGGYINYYYYGLVFVGTLVKMLGILPAVAYNLIIPTLFAMLSLGAFSIAWNLIQAKEKIIGRVPWLVGIGAALMTGLLGNLGSLRMTFRGLAQIGAPGVYAQDAFILTKLGWAGRGIIQNLSGATMPYSYGDLYWIPSRVIPAVGETEPITEFPWFTMIYADLHAHMTALPITVLALGWILSLVLGKFWADKTGRWGVAWSLVFGALAIGALRGTNTWDLPTYLALAVVALIYAAIRYYRPPDSWIKENLGEGLPKILAALLAVAILVVLVFALYLPYGHWYSQPYSEVQPWEGSTSDTNGYLTHWGLYLFILVSWMVWETRQWMAATPLSSLRKLEKFSAVLVAFGIAFAALYGVLFLKTGSRIHWLALPLAVWVGVLLLRPGLPDAKRAVLFMTGTGLFLTIMVEVIVLTGDIGRMNTVFKFYLQVWVLYAAGSAAALGWMYVEARQVWRGLARDAWLVMLAFLVFGAAMFPLLGTYGKIRDRMTADAPHSLDGMAFMPYSEYPDQETVYTLIEDYDAIRWLQDNVAGSPVIVEGNTSLYKWGSRITIYTGLPGVLGWDWHQRQQRGFVPTSDIEGRRQAIADFYTTPDPLAAAGFLAEYQVSYIILGQLERAYYPGEGLDKFEASDGDLWVEVYRDGETVIYLVSEKVLVSE